MTLDGPTTKRTTRLLNAIDVLLNEYIETVEHSRLSASSKVDYIEFATYFVRWLNDEFTPGERVAF